MRFRTVSPAGAWKGARCDEDFSDGGRGRGGGDGADGAGGRLRQQAGIVDVKVVDVKVRIVHVGAEHPQLSSGFFGAGTADRLHRAVDPGDRHRGTGSLHWQPPISNPNGQPGVATTFSTQDGGHVIKDTIQVLADPGAATNALNAAKGAQGGAVKDPTTQSSTVGAGGTTLLGNSPDGSKGVTILLFTEGKALVTLEFDGPADSLAPPDFVTDVGQKQDAAVKKGLGG